MRSEKGRASDTHGRGKGRVATKRHKRENPHTIIHRVTSDDHRNSKQTRKDPSQDTTRSGTKKKHKRRKKLKTRNAKHSQTLATIDEDEEDESNDEVRCSDWETGKTRTTDRLPDQDSTDMSGSNKGNTALMGVEEESKLVKQGNYGERGDTPRLRERSQVTDGGEAAVSDDSKVRQKVEHTEEAREVTIENSTKSAIPRAPRIHELRGIGMQLWGEDIARYRADKKEYAYAKDINNYYAELKGVEDEIKLALKGASLGDIERAWDGMIKREV